MRLPDLPHSAQTRARTQAVRREGRSRTPGFDKLDDPARPRPELHPEAVAAEVYQALSDVGFTIPANAVTYWVGEAMQATDYKDKDPRPEKTAQTTKTAAANAAHLARLLKDAPYPPA